MTLSLVSSFIFLSLPLWKTRKASIVTKKRLVYCWPPLTWLTTFYLVQNLSACSASFSDFFPTPSLSLWSKCCYHMWNPGACKSKRGEEGFYFILFYIFRFHSHFRHFSSWSGIAPNNLCLLLAVSSLPGDTEHVQDGVGKWRSVQDVYCSLGFLGYWDNFDLHILYLVSFDIWEFNKSHHVISFSRSHCVLFLVWCHCKEKDEGLILRGCWLWGVWWAQQSVMTVRSDSASRRTLRNFLNLIGLVMGTIFSRSSTLSMYFNVGKLCPFPSANVWCIPALLWVCLSILGDLEWRRTSSRILSVFFRENDIPKLFHFLTGSGALPKMIKVQESITAPKLPQFFRSPSLTLCQTNMKYCLINLNNTEIGKNHSWLMAVALCIGCLKDYLLWINWN